MSNPQPFTQTAFAKPYEGVDEVGIAVRQRFYPLYDVFVGTTVYLREPPKKPAGCGALFEWSLDGEHWKPLPHFYRNI